MVGLLRELSRRGISVGIMSPVPLLREEWDLAFSTFTMTWLPLPTTFPIRATGFRSALHVWKETRLVATLGRYAAIVGVDPVGIAIACRLNAKARRRMAYISFELMLESELDTEYEIALKTKERAAAQVSDIILIQDEQRRDVFCSENQYRSLAMRTGARVACRCSPEAHELFT